MGTNRNAGGNLKKIGSNVSGLASGPASNLSDPENNKTIESCDDEDFI